MASTKWISIISLLLLPALGCDAIVPVAQPVTLRLTDRQTSAPVNNATVAVSQPATTRPTTAESANTGRVQRLDVGETDPSGLTRIDINTSYIRGGLNGLLFDRPDKDRLTGATYTLHIKRGELTETLPVRLTPGDSTPGKLFSIQVQSIGQPYELRTMPRPAN